MRLAIFSDVYSNMPALEAVLAHIAAAGVDDRYCLGDLVGYAPWPNETLELLQREDIRIVMGNYDDGRPATYPTSSPANYARLEATCLFPPDPATSALGDS